MILKNARAFVDGAFVRTDVTVRDGIITAIGPAAGDGIDLAGDTLLPGFVDVHIHGFMGRDVMEGEAAVRHMSRELRKHGVAAFLPTTMSAGPEETIAALAGIRAVMERPEPDGAVVLGAHMEAPFLNEAYAGAQQKRHFVLPTEETFRAYTGEHASVVRMVTLAPELDGAMPFIRMLAQRGIAVSLGHTGADSDTVHEAADAGARRVTHLFNAQTPLHHRAPGVPGAALTDDRLFCECIADGIHLHPDIVRLITRAKTPAKAVAVTDAMEAAGMPDGQYSLGGQDVFVRDGAARLANGTLAGSTLTMVRAYRNLIAFGIPEEAAAAMTTSTPAASVNEKAYGRIAVGSPAVFARFDEHHAFRGVISPK